MRRLIGSLRFEETGVVVEFDEVYPNGLIRQQTLMIPHAGDYMDEITAVQDALDELVDDVMEDTGLMTPMSAEELRDAAGLDDEDGITMNGGS
jgi:hypothetical protein